VRPAGKGGQTKPLAPLTAAPPGQIRCPAGPTAGLAGHSHRLRRSGPRAVQEWSGGVGNLGVVRATGSRVWRSQETSAAHTSRNAAAAVTAAMVAGAPAFRTASTAITAASAAFTVARTVGVRPERVLAGRAGRCPRPPGSWCGCPPRPPSPSGNRDRCRAEVRDNVEGLISTDRADALVALVNGLETQDSVAPVTALLGVNARRDG